MKLSRTNDKIHTRECRYAHLVWVWAESLSRQEVVAGCREGGLTECRACRPFDGELFDPWFSREPQPWTK